MNKVLKTLGFAGVAVLAGGASAYAASANQAICDLVAQLGSIFGLLRSLAFVGAAFIIAGWAWGYIKGGKAVDVDDVRNKGTGMLVGFILLFSIGMVLQFFMSAAKPGGALDCAQAFNAW